MATLSWYLHRLGAMTPAEMTLRARAKLRQLSDARRTWVSAPLSLEGAGEFPALPRPEHAPEVLRLALRRDAEEILAGRWKAFGWLSLQVDDPPRWHYDYLVDKDIAAHESAFRLNHRALPAGADIKLVWELSRWYQLVRLAMAAYVLSDERARCKCIEWLEDWMANNPPYEGWNWTSPLEAGMRLIQFTWVDALLSCPRHVAGSANGDAASGFEQRLSKLRQDILPAHVHYVWRHRSVGSSANNHLLGELAGCVTAVARWPALQTFACSLLELRHAWEREVLAQFAPDGGNREQALNYHLFSFEFCWQALSALDTAKVHVSGAARQRLALAGRFFVDVQSPSEPWDYGDSDNAFVTPFFAADPVQEWRNWLDGSASLAISYWLGESPAAKRRGVANTRRKGEWRHYAKSGIATREAEPWRLRWDVSPLGYLATAAHGHLDALHLSVWCHGVALVVDPGTGAYFADDRLRTRLASREVHNGPRLEGVQMARRAGPFLWTDHHAVPSFQATGPTAKAVVSVAGVQIGRRVSFPADGDALEVEDSCGSASARTRPFIVRWQFAPGSVVTKVGEQSFSVEKSGVVMSIDVTPNWASVEVGDDLVSPHFREVCRAPFLELTAPAARGQLGPFLTRFTTGGPI